MVVVKPHVQTLDEQRRTNSWRRGGGDRRGRWNVGPNHGPTVEMAARRRLAICRLMDEHGIANTERAHRRAYASLWTSLVLSRLGPPPRPSALVRWRNRLAEREGRSASSSVEHSRRIAG